MEFLKSFLSPLPIAFAVLIVGYFFGRIRFYGVSLDLAGVLIVAVAVGYILTSSEFFEKALNISELKGVMKTFSSLGTSLFVSVIGITAGYSLDLHNTKELKAVFIGSLMVASAFPVMKAIAFLDVDVSYSSLLGALCGALTTTPGLSAVNELPNVVVEEATVGYSGAYLFGVIATVLFVQLISRRSGVYDETTQNTVTGKAALGGLIQIGIAVIFGRIVGSIGFGGFSLGNSGGILCVGIVLGMIIKKLYPQKIATNKTIEIYRNLGLVLFFIGNGIPAGMSFCYAFEVKLILYGALMTIVPIAVGILLSRCMDRENSTASVIAGGMTSTPAIGVLLQKHCRVQLDGYSMAYAGALLTIVVLISFL